MVHDTCENPEVCPPGYCDMRGMLSFLMLWLLSKKPMFGDEIGNEIGRMKGGKPSPGTIYPALKQLKVNGAVKSKREGRRVIYSLTDKGQAGLKEALNYFGMVFSPLIEDYNKQRLIHPKTISS